MQAYQGGIGTITRTGGARQLTYNGHPLYTYIGDTAPARPGATTSTSTAAYGTKCVSPGKTQRHPSAHVTWTGTSSLPCRQYQP